MKSRGLSLTTKLILINTASFFIGWTLISVFGESFFGNIALVPENILSGKKIWTLLTSMFMHGSFFHIFANMFSLFFIGNLLERIIGKKRFFWIYFISGVIGGIFYVIACVVFGGLNTPAVGASGAIFGLLGVLAVLIPWSRVYLIVGPLLLILLEVTLSLIVPLNIMPIFSFLINILMIVMIFSLFSFNPNFRKIAVPLELPMWLLPIIAIVPLTIISYFIPLPIGNSAHIGGLVTGLAYGIYLRKKFPRKTRWIRNHFK